jgi:hypothetical protein
MNATVVVSAVGILVSGVVGPAVSSWAGRRSDAQRFRRDDAARRRDDLSAVVDEAARLLAVGGTSVRLIREAREAMSLEPAEVKEWASSVHVLEERILLRVPATNPIAVTYHAVRESLIALDSTDAAQHAGDDFEARRDSFLEASRVELERSVA